MPDSETFPAPVIFHLLRYAFLFLQKSPSPSFRKETLIPSGRSLAEAILPFDSQGGLSAEEDLSVLRPQPDLVEDPVVAPLLYFDAVAVPLSVFEHTAAESAVSRTGCGVLQIAELRGEDPGVGEVPRTGGLHGVDQHDVHAVVEAVLFQPFLVGVHGDLVGQTLYGDDQRPEPRVDDIEGQGIRYGALLYAEGGSNGLFRQGAPDHEGIGGGDVDAVLLVDVVVDVQPALPVGADFDDGRFSQPVVPPDDLVHGGDGAVAAEGDFAFRGIVGQEDAPSLVPGDVDHLGDEAGVLFGDVEHGVPGERLRSQVEKRSRVSLGLSDGEGVQLVIRVCFHGRPPGYFIGSPVPPASSQEIGADPGCGNNARRPS
ncbi:hypothetical protein SDC9_107070 [bioreactor metagenome]|uniref:Uncharacterized protein n=1 Tax=bioreactor metagenome TaxID=1076179 RepID=A0A645B463_9ZZZZ